MVYMMADIRRCVGCSQNPDLSVERVLVVCTSWNPRWRNEVSEKGGDPIVRGVFVALYTPDKALANPSFTTLLEYQGRYLPTYVALSRYSCVVRTYPIRRGCGILLPRGERRNLGAGPTAVPSHAYGIINRPEPNAASPFSLNAKA